MKQIITTALFLSGMIAYAQTEYNGRMGVNIDTPKATLDIKSISTDKTKGILIPSQTGDELKTNSTSLTANQDGVISYITNGVSTADAVSQNVQFKGLHRLNVASDNTKSWVRLEPSGLEKVKVGNNIGYRMVGVNPNHYGGLGNNAIDFSIRDTETSYKGGAIGDYSVIIGGGSSNDTRVASGKGSMVIGGKSAGAIGDYSVVINGSIFTGKGSVAINGGVPSGENSIAIGSFSAAPGFSAFSMGNSPQAYGDSSVAIGDGGNAKNDSEISFIGSNVNTDGDNNSVPWDSVMNFSNSKAQLFSIGAGYYISDSEGTDVEGNAMVILRDGSTGIALKRTKGEDASTAKPTEKLDVNGNVRVRGVQDIAKRPQENQACDNPGTISFYDDFYGCTSAKVWKKLKK